MCLSENTDRISQASDAHGGVSREERRKHEEGQHTPSPGVWYGCNGKALVCCAEDSDFTWRAGDGQLNSGVGRHQKPLL